MNDLGLIKTFTGAGEINRRRIVAFTGTEGSVALATANTDALCGVTGIHPCTGAGERVDVTQHGYAEVYFGGDVSQGDPVTADANGAAVAAAPAAGVTVRVIGFANQDGSDGEFGQILVAPGTFTGSA